jgi:hypothetical protein
MDADELLNEITQTAALARESAQDSLTWAIEATATTANAQAQLREQVNALLASRGLTPSAGPAPKLLDGFYQSAGAVALSREDDDMVNSIGGDSAAEAKLVEHGYDVRETSPRILWDADRPAESTFKLSDERLYDDISQLHLSDVQAAESREALVLRLSNEVLILSRKGRKRHQHGADLEHNLDEDENASDDSQPGKGGVDAVAARHGLYFGHGGPEKPQSGNKRGKLADKSKFGQRERTLAR